MSRARRMSDGYVEQRSYFIPPLKGEGGCERSEQSGGVTPAPTTFPHPAGFASHPPPQAGEG